MTQKAVTEMGADEFYNWMAYDMLKDEKFKNKIELAKSSELTDEQRSMAIKDMFASIRGS